LIVEDDEMTALVISEYLRSYGYRTTVARNGQEGVEHFIAERPDLALVDVLLPKRDGFDTCYVMKASEHGRFTPVVLMSAAYRDELEAQTYARSLLASEFLKKPFDLDVLLQRIHKLIGPA
jgi:DNA-binding response OmpR family regulator